MKLVRRLLLDFGVRYVDLRALLRQTRDDECPISDNIFFYFSLFFFCLTLLSAKSSKGEISKPKKEIL
jgi:hypothetical protein